MPCPFHHGKDNNLQVNIDSRSFKCYVCNAGGSVIEESDYKDYCRRNKKDFTAFDNDNSALDKWAEPLKKSDDCVPKKENAEIMWDNVIREHIYKDESGNPLYKKTYYKKTDGTKQPIQYRFEEGQWKAGLTAPNGQKIEEVPYNLPNISQVPMVIYCEGEKDCDTLMKLGVYNTTTFGSATKTRLTPDQLAFFKDKYVVFVPDNDRSGYHCVKALGKLLYTHTKGIKVCFIPEVKDISDYVEKYNLQTYDDVVNVLKTHSRLFEEAEELNKYENESEFFVDLVDELSKHKHFPLESLPIVVKEYAEMKEDVSNTHIEYHALSLLSGFASLLQSQYILNVYDGWTAYPSVSFVLVGDSGESKTHPQKDALSILYDYSNQENQRHLDECLEYDKWKDRRRKRAEDNTFREPPKRKPYILNKFTLEGLRDSLKDNPKGILLHVDELDGLFKSMNQYKSGGGDDITALMAALDGENINQALASKMIFISKPRVSLIGSVQRKVLKKCFTEDTKDLGFAFRFLFASPFTKKYFQIKSLDSNYSEVKYMLENKLEGTFEWIHRDLEELNKKVHWANQEVFEIFMDFNNNYINRLKEKHSDWTNEVGGVLSKIVTFTPKIALLLQLIKFYSKESQTKNIEKDTLNQAIRLMQYFIYQNYTLLKTTGERSTDSDYQFFVEYCSKYKVQNNEILCRDLLQKKKKGYKTIAELREKVDALVEVQKALWTDDKKGSFRVL